MRKVSVGGSHPYEVLIGDSLLDEIVEATKPARRVAVIVPEALTATGEALQEALVAVGHDSFLLIVPNAEEQKDVNVLTFLWQRFGELGFTRSDLIIGLGGGATTDVAGFAAATWMRGVDWIAVPTTLVGMVDAAVGGKTGINQPSGKNLVGAFHPPTHVFCDMATLDTLPANDFVAGLAEVIKCGFIADPEILALIEGAPDAAQRLDAVLTPELIERAVRVKAAVVAVDPRERGPREVLNYGHTLAHAIETVERFSWRHGAAVSIGMVFAAELARLAGRLDDGTADRHRFVLSLVGLPTRYRGSPERLLEAMHMDKKTRGSILRFVVLDGLARPAILEGPDPALVMAAFAEVMEEK